MKLKALSHYDKDPYARYGDCILLFNGSSLVIFDCGHKQHAETVEKFLQSNSSITQINIVISHNDSDHIGGICDLLGWLKIWLKINKYSVNIYSHQYLKHVDTILDKIDDGRRNRESLKQSLLSEFDNLKKIIELAQSFGFTVKEALTGEEIGSNCTIVGPTMDEFTDVAAKAVDSRESDTIGEGREAETVMNAASLQLACKLEDGKTILLCGDASPAYLHDLDSYDIIQLPHHGQLDDAIVVFEKLNSPHDKYYLISDNTGSAATSGGSDDLVKHMKEEKYHSALNTKSAPVCLPSYYNDTEEFIENKFDVNLKYNLKIDCEVTQSGFPPYRLLNMLFRKIPLLAKKKLMFSIEQCDVPEPYSIYWKILNRGEEACRRNEIRGQIIKGKKKKEERTKFKGDHYAECYIIKNNEVVARDKILVPIASNEEEQ